MKSVTLSMKFTRGDIVTLKSMVDTPESGLPQRMVIHDWQSHGGYMPNGEPSRESILYWCRELLKERTWDLKGEQACLGGLRLLTGEQLFHEHELIAYVPSEPEGSGLNKTE